MASVPVQTTAPYPEFQRQGLQILSDWTSEGNGVLRDHDGAVLHETEYFCLLRAIIKRNDVVLLRRYLAIHPSALGPGETLWHDPFWTAVANGSTDTLDVMLQHWEATPTDIVAPDARGFSLLQVACAHAQLPTVRFLMDECRPWASRFGDGGIVTTERDFYGKTAIISAATGYRRVPGTKHDELDELMRLLLSKGAHATDAIFPPNETELLQPLTMITTLPAVDQPLNTVLSLAVSGANADTIVRLVDGGADVHTKTIYIDTNGLFDGTCDVAWDVTPLHIASLFANANGIQALRDHRGDGNDCKDMVSCRDSHGRLPIHWAAAGLWAETKATPPDVLRTMELLLAENAEEMVNEPDKEGDTPLHHVVRNSIDGDALDISHQIARLLCEKGAQPNTRGKNGQTALHCLLSAHAARPSSRMMALFKLILAHGGSIDSPDSDGNTVLHLAARSTHHLETVKFLLADASARNGQGARDHLLRAANAMGNTALHIAAASSNDHAGGQSVEARMQAQEAMMTVLTPEYGAGGGDHRERSILGQPNLSGKTPRQLCDERRSTWRKEEDAQRAWTAGLGQGRGRGRSLVAPSLADSPW